MAFVNAFHLAAQAGAFEPQRENHWQLEIALDDVGDQIVMMQGLESFSTPDESSDVVSLEYANERRKVAGKTTFAEVPLVLKDFVDVGIAKALLTWRRQVYNPDTGLMGLARDYKKTANLVLYAPNQTKIRIWRYIGCWPSRVKCGDLTMASGGEVKLEATIQYDRASPTFGFGTFPIPPNPANLPI